MKKQLSTVLMVCFLANGQVGCKAGKDTTPTQKPTLGYQKGIDIIKNPLVAHKGIYTDTLRMSLYTESYNDKEVIDTIKAILLVTDTSAPMFTMQVGGLEISTTEEQWKSVTPAYWIHGYILRHYNTWKQNDYLDDKKKPLPINIIVWADRYN